MQYEDFDLLIEPVGKGYRARVLNSPSGQASKKFNVPFSDLELENFLLRFSQIQRGVRRIESPQMDAAKKFGGQLFNAAFGGQIQNCLLSSIDKTKAKGFGLRIRLRLNEVPKLAGIPWEYLYHAELNRFFSLSDRTPVIRYLEMPEQITPLAIKPPLRILAMVASPTDYDKLDVKREWEKLHEALSELEQRKFVILEELERPTLAALRRRLEQREYHIFHFIGHGGFDEQTQDGVVLMENDRAQGHKVSAQTLSYLLHDQESLRLAVLNACEGALGSVSDPFAGTAQSLVQQGIPAVIAMQFAITDEAAITFSHEFYAAIANGYPVDTALAKSRLALFTEGYGVEWGTPVLHLRSSDGRIFDVDVKGVDLLPSETPSLSFNRQLTKPGGALNAQSLYYVERQSDRIGLREISGDQGTTITILGARQIGKTSLLYKIIEAGVAVNKRFVSINLQQIDMDDLKDAERFFLVFCKSISSELRMEDRTADYWNQSLGVIQRCSDYMSGYILKELGAPLILAMDEVEALFKTRFQSEFFRMLRFWHNNRALVTKQIWRNLDIVIVTSTEPYYFIDDLSQSPFNVATEVRLRDFTAEQVVELNDRYGAPLTRTEVGQLITLVGGHPFLVHHAVYLVASGTIQSSDLFAPPIMDRSPFYDYLQNMLMRLQKNPEMVVCLREVIRSNKCGEVQDFFRLESVGLVRREGSKVVIRCKLYEDFFREYLNG